MHHPRSSKLHLQLQAESPLFFKAGSPAFLAGWAAEVHLPAGRVVSSDGAGQFLVAGGCAYRCRLFRHAEAETVSCVIEASPFLQNFLAVACRRPDQAKGAHARALIGWRGVAAAPNLLSRTWRCGGRSPTERLVPAGGERMRHDGFE